MPSDFATLKMIKMINFVFFFYNKKVLKKLLDRATLEKKKSEKPSQPHWELIA